MDERLSRLQSGDAADQLNGLGWLCHQARQFPITLVPETLERLVWLLHSPDDDVRSAVIQLLSALVKYPTDMGPMLIHLGVLDALPEHSSPDFLADLMRCSPRCQQLVLERDILRAISCRFLTIGQFANLSGAAVRDQPAADLFRDLFSQNVKNIPTANPDDLYQIIIAMKSFILSDDEFLSMFVEKDVISALLARAEGTVKCELELVSFMRTIATHSQESESCWRNWESLPGSSRNYRTRVRLASV
jgi:hypothetical protein